ncbi:hypothetical protein F5051DRAFT_422858 [Lentinula edodes]|nr:hypothetical protein F5051DRAFT_422858 [Lentinula edodes]
MVDGVTVTCFLVTWLWLSWESLTYSSSTTLHLHLKGIWLWPEQYRVYLVTLGYTFFETGYLTRVLLPYLRNQLPLASDFLAFQLSYLGLPVLAIFAKLQERSCVKDRRDAQRNSREKTRDNFRYHTGLPSTIATTSFPSILPQILYGQLDLWRIT